MKRLEHNSDLNVNSEDREILFKGGKNGEK